MYPLFFSYYSFLLFHLSHFHSLHKISSSCETHWINMVHKKFTTVPRVPNIRMALGLRLFLLLCPVSEFRLVSGHFAVAWKWILWWALCLRKSAACPKFDMVWQYRSPIPVRPVRKRGELPRSTDFYLPSLHIEGGGRPCAVCMHG